MGQKRSLFGWKKNIFMPLEIETSFYHTNPKCMHHFFAGKSFKFFPATFASTWIFPSIFLTGNPESFDLHWVWGIPGWRGLFGVPKLEACFFLLQQSVDAPPWWCEFFSSTNLNWTKKCPPKRISASSTSQAS